MRNFYIEKKSYLKQKNDLNFRHAIRTGEGGIGDKLTIGHTIGDRTHVIEKKRDRDGRIRERQSFVNLAQGIFCGYQLQHLPLASRWTCLRSFLICNTTLNSISRY